MIKKIKKYLQVLLALVVLLTLSLVYLGVQDYKALMVEKPISQRVNDIISDDDFVSFNASA